MLQPVRVGKPWPLLLGGEQPGLLLLPVGPLPDVRLQHVPPLNRGLPVKPRGEDGGEVLQPVRLGELRSLHLGGMVASSRASWVTTCGGGPMAWMKSQNSPGDMSLWALAT